MRKSAARRRSPWALLALVVLGLMFTGTAYAALQPSAPAEQATWAATTTAADVEEGKAIFLANCATCHGKNGEGNPLPDGQMAGPPLIGVGAASVDFQMGTGRMPLPQPAVQAPRNNEAQLQDPETIRLVSAYIESLGPGPGLPEEQYLDLEGADIANGGMIFRTNCAMCHNSSGAGGALTRGKYAPDLMNVEPRHIYEAMLTGPQAMPVFNDQNITPQEKEDVIAFLKDIEDGNTAHGGATLGNLGPAGDALFVWTIGAGLLIAVSVWLGRKAA